jgi:3-hydroxyisobutyrate dehydrogenase
MSDAPSSAVRTGDVPSADLTVGFVGLGSQGGPIARRILAGGHPMVVWARRETATDELRSAGAAVADDLTDLGARSDVLGVCVVNDADVRAVLLGPKGALQAMRPGSTVLVHATVHPDTCRELDAVASALGVHLLDAPVSGGGPAAAAGTLLVLVGGDAATLSRIRGVVATYGDPIVHVGGMGAGQLAKLVNNALMAAQLALADDAASLARRLGLDADTVVEAIRHGSGSSFALGVFSRLGGLNGFAHGAALLAKDIGILTAVASGAGIDPPPLIDAARVLMVKTGTAPAGPHL